MKSWKGFVLAVSDDELRPVTELTDRVSGIHFHFR